MNSPIKRHRHSAQPRAHHRANQPAIHLVNRQKQCDSLPPRLAPHAVHVHERQRAQHGHVRAGQQSVRVVRGRGRAEEDQQRGEERRRREGGQEEGEERRL